MQQATQTLPKQISLFTEEQSTYLPEASHASLTALPENDLEKKMTATSGRKCLEQLEKFNRVGLWAKTLADLLIGMEGWYSTRCKLTWKLRGTKSGRMYFQLVPSTLPTEGIGFGLLPTPTTQEPTSECELTETGRRKATVGTSSHGLNLGRMAGMSMLPTPTAVQRDHPERVKRLIATGAKTMMSRNNGENRPNSILDAIMFLGMLPTPTADDNPAKNTGKRNQDGLQKRAFQTTGKTGQLNPLFVAEMMGFPPNYLELPFLNTEMKV